MEFKFKLRNIISKVFSFIIILLSILTIILSLYYLYQIKIKDKNFVNLFGYTVLEVKSGSMESKLLIGDTILVKLVDKDNIRDEIKIDDIITFEQEKHLITHRIIELNEDDLITKGDANNVADKAIHYSSIIGIYNKTIINKNILKQVILEKEVFLPLISGGMLLILALLMDTEDEFKSDSEVEVQNESKKEVYGEKRKKIQKGKRFKN